MSRWKKKYSKQFARKILFLFATLFTSNIEENIISAGIKLSQILTLNVVSYETSSISLVLYDSIIFLSS